uniref:Uncharacterized protein n=1 Tax=Chromera velia CCMP2878 TaxID=1169474 RepID=A0A0G4FBV9_9ALVE|eukprot:Cvel_16261.t1-p1 / transcript=Cvel_16261.t1 / gene=Cvel_16261 / organism=Chromera_velia_CCMP2878 / gene_product=hypothetical protein / transcript_product=hypothetical protein / location=Cvel_scaffold1244:46699-51080(-) / protein_length=196 / sequence_SO=supercontig / SO=protein_coding / is_pseudo=false
MSGAFENEMNRLHQRMEQDVLGRFELFEKEFVRVAQRIGRLESTISALASAEKRNAECLQSFDKKVTLLDELVHKDQNQHLLDQMSDQLVKTRKNVQEDLLESADAVTKLLRTEMQDLESRFAAFEKWFRENITPEIIALKGGLDNEMRTREEADEEVVGLLGRYATVMQKHFGASAEVAACGASGAAGASGLPPR